MIFMNAYISFLLALFLGCFSQHFAFWDQLRVRKRLLPLIYTVVVLASLGILYLLWGDTPSLALVQITKAYSLVPTFLLVHCLIRADVFQELFSLCLTLIYAFILTRLSTFSEVTWLGGRVLYGDFSVNNLIIPGLYLFTLPPYLWMIRRFFVPSLKGLDREIWRFVWLFPALLFAIMLIYTSEVTEHNITNWRSVAAMVPQALGMLFCCYTLLYLLRQSAEHGRLESEMAAVNRQLDMQREQYLQMAQSIQQMAKIQHDIRHHVIAMQGISAQPEKIKQYLAEIEAELPVIADKNYCENGAVNSILGHYLTVARQEGAAIDVWLDIPEDTGRVAAVDLCIILGNLLENAVEAGRYIPQQQRRILLRSRIENDYLSIVCENNFDGKWREHKGTLISRKRWQEAAEPLEGVGFASVRAVCEKYEGLARFSVIENRFQASAVVLM